MTASTRRELRGTAWESNAGRSVKDELRANLVARLQANEPIFPGIVGYEQTVTPQIVNALLSRHNFILLGLRGQAKTRILRQLADLLDPEIPVLADSELHDGPFAPVSVEGRAIVAEQGDDAAIAWLPRSARYVEKLATPDVTVADIVGDIDPIKAARLGTRLGDERSVHYGLLPRANRGIFAMNELPDLSGKVQVALFNVMQEGDVQIKGYPIRLPLDVLLVFSANPEDYTARGKIITPLKDRIGSEVRTHYPASIDEAKAITRQEAWTDRDTDVHVADVLADIVEEVAFVARDDSRVDKHSGVSQRLPISLMENAVSGAEQRSLRLAEPSAYVRVLDLYLGLPAVTGKLELEYEGELRGGEAVARDIVKQAVGQVFGRRAGDLDVDAIVAWFDEDHALKVPDHLAAAQLLEVYADVPGLLDAARELAEDDAPEATAVAAEFVLEGLHARKQIARSEERGFVGVQPDVAGLSGATSRRRYN